PAADRRSLIVPARLSTDVIGVTGPNGTRLKAFHSQVAVPTAKITTDTGTKSSTYWGQRTVALHPGYRHITQATTAVCGYAAKQLRAAYGLPPGDPGAGTTIALVQDGAPVNAFKSLTRWAKLNGL